MSVPTLKIAPGFSLPVDVAGEAIAILAKRGAGKTNTGRVLAEELVGAHIQTIVLDPVGAWWGLRSSADGKGQGLSLPIFGGAHGDVPLEATAGKLLADVVVDSGQSLVLDLSDFSKGDQRRFVTDFAERLYQRKARQRQLLHLILEEADEFVPQRVSAGDARMVGAIEALVRRGRGRGIGLTMITQRSASLNKAVLEQADVLIVMRTTGPRDRAAVEAWVSKQDVDGADKVLPSLPSLDTGEAWVWNPERGVLRRVQIRLARTFDSSSTPKAGERRVEPKKTATIDLAALGEQIQATAERAKENDPAELRRRVKQLQAELAKRPTKSETVEVEKVVERSVLTDEDRYLLKKLAGVQNSVGQWLADLAELKAVVERAAAVADAKPPASRPTREPRPAPTRLAPVERAPAVSADGDTKLGKGERTVLEVLAEYPDGRTKNELAFLAGYSAKASTINVILSSLRREGLVEAGNSPVRATAAGLAAAGGVRERPTGKALLDEWLRHPRMGEGERRVLLALIDADDDELTHDELCERTGYSPIASTMNVILSKLRKLGLVEKGARRIAPEFREAIDA